MSFRLLRLLSIGGVPGFSLQSGVGQHLIRLLRAGRFGQQVAQVLNGGFLVLDQAGEVFQRIDSGFQFPVTVGAEFLPSLPEQVLQFPDGNLKKLDRRLFSHLPYICDNSSRKRGVRGRPSTSLMGRLGLLV